MKVADLVVHDGRPRPLEGEPMFKASLRRIVLAAILVTCFAAVPVCEAGLLETATSARSAEGGMQLLWDFFALIWPQAAVEEVHEDAGAMIDGNGRVVAQASSADPGVLSDAGAMIDGNGGR
jgi:hypothetical protein